MNNLQPTNVFHPPKDDEDSMSEIAYAGVATLLWILALIVLASSPAIVIAVWRWAL